MGSKSPTEIRTCKSCGHDNPNNAKKCNGCGSDMFIGMFDKENFHQRWGCPECSRVNMKANSKCMCGYEVSGCFLTTACVTFAGMPDDCETLTSMRKLRDEYVINLPEGRALISEYYEVAPKIVYAIEGLNTDIKNVLYSNMLLSLNDITHCVKSGDYINAKDRYMKMYAQTRDLLLMK